MVRFELLISEVTAQPTHLQSSWWLSEWLVIITACNVNLATFIILVYLLKFVNSKPLILFLLVRIIRQTKPKAKIFSCRWSFTSWQLPKAGALRLAFSLPLHWQSSCSKNLPINTVNFLSIVHFHRTIKVGYN